MIQMSPRHEVKVSSSSGRDTAEICHTRLLLSLYIENNNDNNNGRKMKIGTPSVKTIRRASIEI